MIHILPTKLYYTHHSKIAQQLNILKYLIIKIIESLHIHVSIMVIL